VFGHAILNLTDKKPEGGRYWKKTKFHK
jgi:hypothetical protein